MKKLIAAAIALLMVFAILPTIVSAEVTEVGDEDELL